MVSIGLDLKLLDWGTIWHFSFLFNSTTDSLKECTTFVSAFTRNQTVLLTKDSCREWIEERVRFKYDLLAGIMWHALLEGTKAAAQNGTVPPSTATIWHEQLRRSQSEMIHVKAVSIQLGVLRMVEFLNQEREAIEKLEAEINQEQSDPLFRVQSVFQLGKEAFDLLKLTPITRVASRQRQAGHSKGTN